MRQGLQQNQIKVRKSLPLIDVNILDIIKQNKIKGVYGFLINFV